MKKLNIAMQHLLQKQIERNGLKKGELTIEEKRDFRYYPLLHP